MPSLDIVTWHPFQNCLRAPTTLLFFNARTTYKLGSGRQMRLGISWKNQFQFSNIINIKVPVTQKLHSRIIKAVATVEPNCLVHSQDGPTIASSLEFESNSQMLLSSAKDDSELDDREKLRRSRISKANKGNVPWNKGRKHSPETLQRIRERTRIAMQDPKVKMKLVNIGHAQSEETRVKIGIGVREGWQRRHEKLLVQETCCLEWQNMIAEASRKGYNGEEELQWDSYKFLDNELKKQWLEGVEKRKTMPRPKGSKRAPKSLEQRRKISEAISAKWADPGYRNRVCSALAKYHGVPVGAERKPWRKRPHQSQSAEQVLVKKKSVELNDGMFESKVIKKSTRKKKNAAPMYKDPMASAKLEMIKKIKAQRTEMENRKREATERAKLLIAEAEKAAEALEVAALKSPLARASLLETRKLIAEATWSIESIESGDVATQDNGNGISPSREPSIRHPLGSPGGPVGHTLPVEGKLITEVARSIESIDSGALASQDNANSNSGIREVTARLPLGSHEDPLVGNMLPVEEKVNGTHQLSSSDRSTEDLEFDKLTLQNAVNGSQHLPVIRNADNSTGGINSRMSPSFQLNNASEKSASDGKVLQVGLLKFKGECKNESTGYEENQKKQISKVENSKIPAARTKKKWISGRFVEVEED